MSVRARALLVVPVLLLPVGCSHAASSAPLPSPLVSSARPTSDPNPATFTPAPEGAPLDADASWAPSATVSAVAVPTSDPDRSAARAQAVVVMRLWARPRLDHATWWAQLRPHLSAQAQRDYQYVQPDSILATRVLDQGRVVPTDAAKLARIHVFTDEGTYLVVLSRTSDRDSWLVERITPPEQGEI